MWIIATFILGVGGGLVGIFIGNLLIPGIGAPLGAIVGGFLGFKLVPGLYFDAKQKKELEPYLYDSDGNPLPWFDENGNEVKPWL